MVGNKRTATIAFSPSHPCYGVPLLLSGNVLPPPAEAIAQLRAERSGGPKTFSTTGGATVPLAEGDGNVIVPPAEEAKAKKVKKVKPTPDPHADTLSALACLSKPQLIEVLKSVCGTDEEKWKLAAESLPEADLTEVASNLEKLQSSLEKAFPQSKWGSNMRDPFCYRRVSQHVQNLKQAILEPLKVYAPSLKVQLKYLLEVAMPQTCNMPTGWVESKHEKPRLQTAKSLMAAFKKVAKTKKGKQLVALKRDAWNALCDRTKNYGGDIFAEIRTIIEGC